MPRSLTDPFTEAEMQAIRRAANGEASGDHANEAHVKRNFWSALRRIARNTPFAHDLAAAYYCARDPETPLRVRMILFGALGYFILPLDAVSDLLPLVGFTDDIAVLTLAIATAATAIKPEHRAKAREALTNPPGATETPDDEPEAADKQGGWRPWAPRRRRATA